MRRFVFVILMFCALGVITFAQTATDLAPVVPHTLPNHIADQAAWALIASYVLEWLKTSGWFTFLTPASTEKLKQQFGLVVAAATAAGVHFAVTGSFLDGNGVALTLTGLSFNVVKDIALQWAAQQAWYDAIVKQSPQLTPLSTIERIG